MYENFILEERRGGSGWRVGGLADSNYLQESAKSVEDNYPLTAVPLPAFSLTCQRMQIMGMIPEHWPAVEEIYQQGIDTRSATFETQTPSWEVFDKKFMQVGRLVAVENNIVTGWIALVPVSQRECYRGIAEISVYIHNDHHRKGIGRALMERVSEESEKAGYWSLLSVIHEENAASIRLHEQCGYRMIGRRERIACLHGIWKTTVMMEKRSTKIGI